jgi:hypothetical protein
MQTDLNEEQAKEIIQPILDVRGGVNGGASFARLTAFHGRFF